LVELGAVLVPVPVPGLPFVAHLLDPVSSEITLKAGSVNAHKLTLTGKIGLMATLLHLALPGDEVNFPRRVSEHNTSQLEYDGIVAAEHIASVSGPGARLPFRKDFIVTTAQMVGLFYGHNRGMDSTSVVRFLELEKVRAQSTLLCLQ
jgi:hypothetical protein